MASPSGRWRTPAWGGQIDRITSARRATSATEPASSSPAASARASVAALRPSDAHSTLCPAARRTPPTTAPISPGCSRPTTELLAVMSAVCTAEASDGRVRRRQGVAKSPNARRPLSDGRLRDARAREVAQRSSAARRRKRGQRKSRLRTSPATGSGSMCSATTLMTPSAFSSRPRTSSAGAPRATRR